VGEWDKKGRQRIFFPGLVEKFLWAFLHLFISTNLSLNYVLDSTRPIRLQFGKDEEITESDGPVLDFSLCSTHGGRYMNVYMTLISMLNLLPD
jgi:hypothetical protein